LAKEFALQAIYNYITSHFITSQTRESWQVCKNYMKHAKPGYHRSSIIKTFTITIWTNHRIQNSRHIFSHSWQYITLLLELVTDI